MKVLGIETSCDECSSAVVENGKKILSNVIATQLDFHKKYYGVVPEIASRLHTEWIYSVVKEAIDKSGLKKEEIDGIAVTNRPGLLGSLHVGLSFAKGLSFSLNKPLICIDHIKAHLYAVQLEYDVEYPFIGLLVSGGHTILCKVESYDNFTVYGTTIDDACGEAFDKIAKYYDMGFPGGLIIDNLSKNGNDEAFNFPKPNLYKGSHKYDVSYSGLKTAVINQSEKFRNKKFESTKENIAASFQRTAIEIILRKLFLVLKDTGINTVVAGGGVAANSCLRKKLLDNKKFKVFFPSLKLCTDNGAMIAGIGYQYLKDGISSPLNETVYSKIKEFRRSYP